MSEKNLSSKMSWAVPNTGRFREEYFEQPLKTMQNQDLALNDFSAVFTALQQARKDSLSRQNDQTTSSLSSFQVSEQSDRGSNWKAMWGAVECDNKGVMEHIIEICLFFYFLDSLKKYVPGHDERVWDRTKGTYAENFARALLRVKSVLSKAQTTMKVNRKVAIVRGPEISGSWIGCGYYVH